MIFHIILGIVLALILNMKFKGKKFLRTIVLIPWAMPMIVAGRAARWGFNGQYGFVNDLIGRFVENFHYDWLIDVDSARIAVIIVDLWKDIPYFAILVLAALQYISGDIYEAAKIDGANAVRAFFSITLPNIAKTVLSISIFFTMWRVTNFELVYAMTSGGPHDGTAVLAYKILIPLLKPAIATICIINFINCLNEFFIPLFFSQKISVLTVGISTLPRANAYDVPWDLLSAMGCVILLPIIVFVMIFEEKIMDGIMAGGVKS